MKRSGYLQQRDVRTQMLLDVMQRTMKQYMLDTLLITMHEAAGAMTASAASRKNRARHMTPISRRCRALRNRTCIKKNLTGRRAVISGITSFIRSRSATRKLSN